MTFFLITNRHFKNTVDTLVCCCCFVVVVVVVYPVLFLFLLSIHANTESELKNEIHLF